MIRITSLLPSLQKRPSTLKAAWTLPALPALPASAPCAPHQNSCRPAHGSSARNLKHQWQHVDVLQQHKDRHTGTQTQIHTATRTDTHTYAYTHSHTSHSAHRCNASSSRIALIPPSSVSAALANTAASAAPHAGRAPPWAARRRCMSRAATSVRSSGVKPNSGTGTSMRDARISACGARNRRMTRRTTCSARTAEGLTSPARTAEGLTSPPPPSAPADGVPREVGTRATLWAARRPGPRALASPHPPPSPCT